MADRSFDLVVVGSGVGGLTAAVTAKLAGLSPLLLEKTPLIGGSSAWSGGVLWLPGNPLMTREGIADSREAGLRYLENFVGPDDRYSTPRRREAFLDIAEREPLRCRVVDATKAQEAIAAEVLAIVEPLLPIKAHGRSDAEHIS